jgi:MSHA pilin protein MshC
VLLTGSDGRVDRGLVAQPVRTWLGPACAGFTMIELIVVMILIGVLGAIASARFFNRSGFDVPAFADQAEAALRFAQKEAIAQNRPVYVRLDGASISLCYDTSSPCSQLQRVVAPFSVSTDSTYCTASNWYCVRGPANVTYKVARGSGNLSLPITMAFDALGRPLDAALVQLSAATTVSVAAGSESATVTVEPDTGYVH